MDAIKRLKDFIYVPKEDLNSLLKAFFFFYSVLCAWYVLRPVRNEMAVQAGLENLPGLLSIVLLIMLIANPVYSWLVSKVNKDRVIVYTYLFFILNLILFFMGWNFLDAPGRVFIAKAFYIWCNVFSFFVVSIFWVAMINYFSSNQAKLYFGIISAGGSLGAFTGSSIARYFSTQVCGNETMSDWGPFSLILVSVIGLTIAILLSYSFPNRRLGSSLNKTDVIGGSSFESILSVFRLSSIRNLSFYMILWTGLMTLGWMIALGIIQEWSNDSCERTAFFARIEQIVTPLTLFCQFFVTSFILRKLGTKIILVVYGLILFLALLAYASYPEVTTVLIVVAVLRTFEYGFNKPTRETLFTSLQIQQRYKSTVFMDTFLARGGEVIGSLFATKGIILLGLTTMGATWFAMPFAALLSWTGYRAQKIVNK